MGPVTYDDPVKNTVEAFGEDGFKYGSEIPEEWFMEKFRIEPAQTAEDQRRNTMLYARYMGSVRARLLREKNMALRTKPGIGQEVVYPSEQTAWAMRSFQEEIVKTYRKADDRIQHINYGLLTDQEKKENSDAFAKLSFFANRTVKRLNW